MSCFYWTNCIQHNKSACNETQYKSACRVNEKLKFNNIFQNKMGIPYYFGQLLLKYPDIIVNNVKDTITQFMFDYNALIHPIAHKVLATIDEKVDEKDDITREDVINQAIIDACIEETRVIESMFPALQTYVIMDGVCPSAKSKQQRERRFKSSFLNETSKWDTNAISVDTPFMNLLSQNIRKHLPHMIVSDSKEQGEGEHKIFQYAKNTGTIVISSADADLIMLSLLFLQKNPNVQIYLLRRQELKQESYDDDAIKKDYLVDLRKLKHYLEQELSDNLTIFDYIFVCFFCGNDFLPHSVVINIRQKGINVLMSHLTEPLIDSHTLSINSNALSRFIKKLAQHEDYLISKYEPETDSLPENLPENVQVLNKDVIQYHLVGYKPRYYQYYSIDNPLKASEQYIRGLYWTWEYYLGKQHDWSWYYPYRMAPFFYHLKQITQVPTFNKTKPNDTQEQLFYILPKSSGQKFIKNKTILNLYNLKCIEHYFPKTLTLDVLHKRHFWEAQAIIPVVPSISKLLEQCNVDLE